MECFADEFSARVCPFEQRLAELQRTNRRLRLMIGALV
jgi:hypothetical protein